MAKKTARKVWTDAEKEALILEMEKLPEGGVDAWARGKGWTGELARKMRERYLKAHPDFGKSVPTVKPHSGGKPSRTPEQMRAILDEYQPLTGYGAKKQYLKERGMNHQTIHDFKKHLGLPIAHMPKRARPKRKAAGFAAISPDKPPVTLDEAIDALEIEQDAVKKVIETLRRMRGR